MRKNMNTTTNGKKSLPIVNSKGSSELDVDAELAAFEAEERKRLGIDDEVVHWTDKMVGLDFKKSEKPNITLLIGGLTMVQDTLIEASLKGLGYNVQHMRCPDTQAFQTGKEYGNRGQCNPTYFTVGNLIQTLIDLRDKDGLSVEHIVKHYVFLTAGACGPCRFGMYVTEYRKALRDAGFDGFRVMLFQQTGGLKQATGEESGLEMNPAFFAGIVKGVIAGDVLNAIGYRIRPYEVEPGATDRALAEVKQNCYDALKAQKSILWALARSRKIFEAVKIDHRRVLGDDDRGRRQLSAPEVPRRRGRGERHPARDGVAPLQHLGSQARHGRSRRAPRAGQRQVRPRRARRVRRREAHADGQRR
jgi:hypothetical protein